MDGAQDDRRRYERFDVFAQISVGRRGEVSLLSCSDISAGGVRIELDRGEIPGVDVGARVDVRLDLGSDKRDRPLVVDAEAEVVRVDIGGPDRNPGFALMWTSQDAIVARQLAVILEHLHGE